MKSTVSASIVACAALAMAQEPARFTLVTASSNNALHLQNVTASGSQLWIGKPTESYCPTEQVGAGCPAGNITSFTGGNNTLGMNVMVPGGQQVYVNTTGAIKYTQAHSAGSDIGSNSTGWQYETAIMDGYGQLLWNGQHGFLACPSSDGSHSIQTFQENAVPAGCEQVDLLVPTDTATGNTGITDATAWQYT